MYTCISSYTISLFLSLVENAKKFVVEMLDYGQCTLKGEKIGSKVIIYEKASGKNSLLSSAHNHREMHVHIYIYYINNLYIYIYNICYI